MGYEIKNITSEGDTLKVLVNFESGSQGSVPFAQGSTKEEILLKLDEIESNYQASIAASESKLSDDIKSLVGFKK